MFIVPVGFGSQGAAQQPIYLRHKDPVKCLAFSPDGKFLATGDRRTVESLGIGARGAFYLWDIDKQKPVTTFKWYPDGAGSLVFSPDGKTIALEAGQSIRLWDAATRTTRTTLKQRTVYSTVSGMAYSPDGMVLAVTFFQTLLAGKGRTCVSGTCLASRNTRTFADTKKPFRLSHSLPTARRQPR